MFGFAWLGRLYEGDVMCKCDSASIFGPSCHIEGIMSFINFWQIYCDVSDGLSVPATDSTLPSSPLNQNDMKLVDITTLLQGMLLFLVLTIVGIFAL